MSVEERQEGALLGALAEFVPGCGGDVQEGRDEVQDGDVGSWIELSEGILEGVGLEDGAEVEWAVEGEDAEVADGGVGVGEVGIIPEH